GTVAALLSLDEIAADPFGPDRELVDGGGTKRVGGDHRHALAVVLEAVGDFGDRGGFAGAVDADDHDDMRCLGDFEEWAGISIKKVNQAILEQAVDVVG